MAFDDLQRARLQWMFDNQPEWVKELLDKGKLEVLDQSILNSVITAINMENKLQEKGMNYAQAHDFAVDSLTPADGPYFTDPQPPPPLSQEDQARVRAALEAGGGAGPNRGEGEEETEETTETAKTAVRSKSQ